MLKIHQPEMMQISLNNVKFIPENPDQPIQT